ncbi:endopeptidase La [soil metagenome]
MAAEQTNEIDELLPERIPVLPIRSTVVFPMGATALQIAWAPNVEALTAFPREDLLVAVAATLDDATPVDPASLEKVACSARVLDRLYLSGGVIQITLQGRRRIRMRAVRYEDGYYTAAPEYVEEPPVPDAEAERLIELILTTVGGVAAKIERIPDEVPRILRNNVADPGRFADLVATLCHFNVADRDEVLQTLDVVDRLDFVLGKLQETWEQIREIEAEHQLAESATGGGEAPQPRRNRPVELRNRIRSLQAELGEIDPAEREAVETLRRITRAQLPSRVAARARLETERLRELSTTKAEAAEIRSFLDALLSVPWSRTSDGGPVDLAAVGRAMDEEHLGLEEAKRRILETLSVVKLRGSVPAPIPCLVGPPDVGKSSLAGAVARGLGRPLARVELGGRSEAQLVGSRRTRTTAQPGKLVSALSEAGVRDPVFLLQEIDEVALGSLEGDPVKALEELLDPANRSRFVDRYLDAPVDLSMAIFIATATEFYRIPPSLREYLIEIRIAGYTPEEKVEIARERLLPALVAEHGLSPADLTIDSDALLFLTRGYARDAGLGNLRRSLSALLRYLAHEKAFGVAEHWMLEPELIQEVLGAPRYMSTSAENAPEVGVATGLAWTAAGGELMFIEALRMPGSGRLIITGLLGDVMRESVSAAYSYVRSRAAELGIAADAFERYDVHVHFPVGAIPKDGPSAGGAVTLAIASALSERPVRHDLALTGEVTLRGRVLEIGGVKEKTLAAYRAGLREVILPAANERDLREVPEDVREGMTFHFAERMDEIFQVALLPRSALHALPGFGGGGGGTETGSRAAAEAEG